MLAARPPPLVEVPPQLGVQPAHFGADYRDLCAGSDSRCSCAAAWGEQVVEFKQNFDVLAGAELVIEVPKISLDMARRRMADCSRPPQTAEQLVEVPTIISYSSLQRSVEQNIDIAVPQVRGRGGGGLQGFRPGQGSPAADVEQIVENPVSSVLAEEKWRGLQSSLPGLGSTAYLEQIVDFPTRGGPQGFLPGQGSSSSSRFPWRQPMKEFKGFSHFYPVEKKCGVGSALGVRTGCGLYSMDSGGLCRVHGGRLRRGGGVGGGGGDCGGGGGGGRCDSHCCWFSAPAGLHAVPQAPVGMARAGVCLWR